MEFIEGEIFHDKRISLYFKNDSPSILLHGVVIAFSEWEPFINLRKNVTFWEIIGSVFTFTQ
jgi:hypothetical protein